MTLIRKPSEIAIKQTLSALVYGQPGENEDETGETDNEDETGETGQGGNTDETGDSGNTGEAGDGGSTGETGIFPVITRLPAATAS